MGARLFKILAGVFFNIERNRKYISLEKQQKLGRLIVVLIFLLR
jgi:hypothetical protein